MEIKISVIMLTYNREKLVQRAIESVLNQTYKNIEFIIVDNGSEDKSGEVVEYYAKMDKRIKPYHISKCCIGAGRNFGLRQATGEYVAFIDDDDWMYEDMLEYLVDFVKDYNADIVLCGSQKEIEGKIFDNCCFDKVLVMNSGESVIELLKRKKYNAAYPTKLLKKELFDQIPFREDGKYDDITVVYKHFALAKCVVAGGEPKYCFRRHESNNSAFTTNDLLLTEDQLEEYLAAFRERTEWLSAKLPSIADYAQYSEWSYMISMCNKIEKNQLRSCYQVLKRIKKILIVNYDVFFYSEYIQDFEKEWMKKYIAPERNRK
ncbi:glycosyltransferase family 2 protein [Roseburia sp. 499]|uniref:glycosyltransferase family 2 protein n=1 Tax=Roseburia sp. 499 TaxID=1261634 RepID=UPI0009516E07|nr:glycosyltransferase family A protein [Roseburia sp. 499]WVK70039.1 glycosyltransferase family A protein [Roseburia sp. 499]